MVNNESALLAHPVLDDIAYELSREYTETLGKMNADIAQILSRARGMEKSEGLYLASVEGTVEEMILKALPRKKASEEEVKQKRKEARTTGKNVGTRGGKWYRDKQGHIRYGTKPAESEREWRELDEEEVKALHGSLATVYGYHPTLTKSIDDTLLLKHGISGAILLQTFRDSEATGLSVEEFWQALAEEAGLTSEQAAEALSQTMASYRDLLQDSDFKEQAKAAIRVRQSEEERIDKQLSRTARYSKAHFKKLLTENPQEEALRLMSLMKDMELLHLPETDDEAMDSADTRTEARALKGNIIPNHGRITALLSRLGDLTEEQVAAVFVAQMFRDMREGRIGFENEHITPAETYLKEKDGKYKALLLDAGYASEKGEVIKPTASVVERTNDSLNIALQGALVNAAGVDSLDNISDDELNRSVSRFRELADIIHSYLNGYNRNRGGGGEVGAIFTNKITADKLFRGGEATPVAQVAKAIEQAQVLIKEALAAQSDDSFETPPGLRAGFDAMSKEKGKKIDLFAYQRQALAWMSKIKRGILAFDTGLGKSPCSIGFVAHLMEQVKAGKLEKEDARGVMVMPKGLIAQWPSEIRKFFPDAKIVTIGEAVTNAEDRIKVLNAISSGLIEADFVLISSSVVNFHEDTRDALKASGLYVEGEDSLKRKKGTTLKMDVEAKRKAAEGDPLCSALRSLRGCVFFDEAHHSQQGLKVGSNVSNAAAREFLKDREHSFLLTATPMPNGKPKELFELMDLVHEGSAGPDARKFENGMIQWRMNPDTQEMEAMPTDDYAAAASDIAPYVFRKMKLDADVLAANEKAGVILPKLHGDEGEEGSATHGLLMPEEMKKLFEKAGQFKPYDWEERNAKLPTYKQRKWVPYEELEGGQSMRELSQMQQLAITPRMLLGDAYKGPEPKLAHLADLTKKHFQDPKNHDKPIVVFSQFPSSFEHIKRVLSKSGIDPSLVGEYHGDVSDDDKAALAEATNAGKIKVLLVGIGAGGAGLNLQKAANKVIHLDNPWSLSDKLQSLGRVWRMGQDSDVTAINMHMQGSLDLKKTEGLAVKGTTDAMLASAHLGNEAAASRALNMLMLAAGGGQAKKIDSMSEGEIAARLEHLGLTGLATPEVLKQKFNLRKYSETLEAKRNMEFGQGTIEQLRTLAQVSHALGETNKEEYAKAIAKLGRQEREWARINKLMGNADVQVAKDVSIQPAPSFVINKDVKLHSAASPMAKQVFVAIKKKGALPFAVEDFVDEHIKEQVDVELAKDPSQKDHVARFAILQKYYDGREALEKEATKAFKELANAGVISSPSNTKKEKPEDVALPKPKDVEEKLAPVPLEGPMGVKGSKGPNLLGGWAYDFSHHTKTKESESAKADILVNILGKNTRIAIADIADVFKELPPAKRPTSLSGIMGTFQTDELSARRIATELHAHKYMV